MARPKTKTDARKARVVSFRVTDSEFARLAQRAAAANMRLNDFVRTIALTKTDTLKVKTYMRYDPMLISELNRIGNNLNQMVKRYHVTGKTSPYLEALCDRIDELIDQAIEAEGV